VVAVVRNAATGSPSATTSVTASAPATSGQPPGGALPPSTPAPSPSRSPSQRTATPADPSTAAVRTFGDGAFAVPGSVRPGTYRTLGRPDDCSWSRSARVGGAVRVLGRGIGDDGPAIATIEAGDVEFRSAGCGRWTSDPRGAGRPASEFGQGTFRVGLDIVPGTYTSLGGGTCLWQRLSGFGGNRSTVVAQGTRSGATTVTIAPTDRGFFSVHCGAWHRG
jgi:hypothetical protein